VKEKGSSLFPAAISMQIFCARVSLRLPIENSMGRTFPQREREKLLFMMEENPRERKAGRFYTTSSFCGEGRVLWRWR